MEDFLMRFFGGTLGGADVIVTEQQFPWPLPGIIPDIGGHYFKKSESDLPPQNPGSHIMRSAEYHWCAAT
jgi:hypothetical protein